MFTKHDIESYCSQLMEVEQRMERVYGELAGRFSEDKYRTLFKTLSREEHEHAEKVRELLAILTSRSD